MRQAPANNRTVHIFISSTFQDMQAARDYLAKSDLIDPEAQFYNHTCLSARLAMSDEAFLWLDKHVAKEKEPNFEWMQQDTDLESLRADPRWEGKLREWKIV